MLALITLTTLMAAAKAATAFPVGSAYVAQTESATPSCVAKFTLGDQSGENCKLRVVSENTRSGGLDAGDNVKFYIGTTDMPDATNDVVPAGNEVDCGSAGDRFIAVTGELNANVGVVTVMDGVVTIAVPDSQSFRSAPLNLAKDEHMIIHFEVPEGELKPFFDFDRNTADIAKTFDVKLAKEGTDPATGGDVTLDKSQRTDLTIAEAGKYSLWVKASDDDTSFRVVYTRNGEAEKASYVDPKCTSPCAGPDNCTDCQATNGCLWCAVTTLGKEVSSGCTSGVDGAGAECSTFQGSKVDTCPADDAVDAACKKLDSCEACAGDETCVWCDTTGFTGSCSAGRGNLGEECTAPGISPTELAKCPKDDKIDEACKKLEGCKECNTDENCVWCDSTGFTGSCSAGKDNLGLECSLGSAPVKDADCPVEDPCAKHDCKTCIEDSECNYCAGLLGARNGCQTSKECGTGLDLRTDVGECDPDDECKFEDCKECADNEKCVWCNSGLRGSCSAGKDGEGKECKLITAGDPITADKCPVEDPCGKLGCGECIDNEDCTFCGGNIGVGGGCQTSDDCGVTGGDPVTDKMECDSASTLVASVSALMASIYFNL